MAYAVLSQFGSFTQIEGICANVEGMIAEEQAGVERMLKAWAASSTKSEQAS